MVYSDGIVNHLHVNDAYYKLVRYNETPEADWRAKSVLRKDGTSNIYPVYFNVKTGKFIKRREALEILENQLRRLEERL